MTTNRKHRTVHLCLVALTLWPAVQIALVRTADVSSWKLAGFGMYATPQRVPGLRVHGVTGGRVHPLFRGAPPSWLADELARFRRYRRALGQLQTPDRLAQRVLDERPELDGVGFVVVELVLDPKSAMLGERETRYAYRRDSTGSAARAARP